MKPSQPIPFPRHTPVPRHIPAIRRREAGFSLIEMLIATLLSTMLIIGILNVFEANGRVARVQADISEMQQAQRVAQYEMVRLSRMAGRGGLPKGNLPLGLAISVRNNADISEHISPGVGTTPDVLDATDVLTIRGVLTGPIYQIAYANPANFVLDGPGATATSGQIRIQNPSNTSIPQDLTQLIDAVANNRPEALIMVSPLSDAVYAVLELDPANSNASPGDTEITLGFHITGGTYSTEYAALSAGGAFTPDIANTGVAYLGILEEYRYYIREVRVGGDLFPSLVRAQVYPGTENVYAGDAANWATPIAPEIYDLQVAIGVDDPVGGTVGVVEDGLAAGTASSDEWLYNDATDNDGDARWDDWDLYSLRLSTLVRSSQADARYEAPILQSIEDRSYAGSSLNTDPDQRKHRRRTVVTVVDLRNLG